MRLHPQTCVLTAVTYQRHRVFQREENALLMVETLFRYRDQARYRLYGFVVMPDHVHALASPNETVEKAAQMIKGGFSFAVRRQFPGEVWQVGYHGHRVVDGDDYWNQLGYIARNPVKRGYEDYAYVHTRFVDRLDPAPAVWVRGEDPYPRG